MITSAERQVLELGSLSTMFAAAVVAAECDLIDSGMLSSLTVDAPPAVQAAYWATVRDAAITRIDDLRRC